VQQSLPTGYQLSAKFGRAAKAAQLLETEPGTLLISVRAIEKGWHVTPDPVNTPKALEKIEADPLGVHEGKAAFDERFAWALKARNHLNHGFHERYNFKIQNDEGRDGVIADVEELHKELFESAQPTLYEDVV
jgi:hypothetical protein